MICVRDLVAIKSLGLSMLAGASGGHRFISWAHTVDLPDPWRWVSAGVLVMTTGGGLPKSAEDQALWLEKLAKTRASALIVALRPDAPKLSSLLLNTADRLSFPVVEGSFELEFATLSPRY
jgi:purine catabolism regulator